MTNVIKGSLLDVSPEDVTAAFVKAKLLVIGDVSGSMATGGHNGKSKWENQCDVLVDLQAKYPGQVVVGSFGDEPGLHLDGVLPPASAGRTKMIDALAMAKDAADFGIRTVLISDGEPTDIQADILAFAKENLVGSLDVVCCDHPGSRGEAFMQSLANITAGGVMGHHDFSSNPEQLTKQLEVLLLKAG